MTSAQYSLILLAVVVCLALPGALSGCGKSSAKHTDATAPQTTSTEASSTASGETSQAPEQKSSADDPVDKTIWLTFSKTGYTKERAAVKQHYSRDYDVLKKVDGDNYYERPVYITKHDLNNDGNDELIVFMVGTFWGGGHASGRLYVMTYDGAKITAEYSPASFPLDYNKLDQQGNNQVGIIRRENGSYDFIVLGSLWKYQMSWLLQQQDE